MKKICSPGKKLNFLLMIPVKLYKVISVHVKQAHKLCLRRILPCVQWTCYYFGNFHNRFVKPWHCKDWASGDRDIKTNSIYLPPTQPTNNMSPNQSTITWQTENHKTKIPIMCMSLAVTPHVSETWLFTI